MQSITNTNPDPYADQFSLTETLHKYTTLCVTEYLDYGKGNPYVAYCKALSTNDVEDSIFNCFYCSLVQMKNDENSLESPYVHNVCYILVSIVSLMAKLAKQNIKNRSTDAKHLKHNYVVKFIEYAVSKLFDEMEKGFDLESVMEHNVFKCDDLEYLSKFLKLNKKIILSEYLNKTLRIIKVFNECNGIGVGEENK